MCLSVIFFFFVPPRFQFGNDTTFKCQAFFWRHDLWAGSGAARKKKNKETAWSCFTQQVQRDEGFPFYCVEPPPFFPGVSCLTHFHLKKDGNYIGWKLMHSVSSGGQTWEMGRARPKMIHGGFCNACMIASYRASSWAWKSPLSKLHQRLLIKDLPVWCWDRAAPMRNIPVDGWGCPELDTPTMSQWARTLCIWRFLWSPRPRFWDPPPPGDCGRPDQVMTIKCWLCAAWVYNILFSGVTMKSSWRASIHEMAGQPGWKELFSLSTNYGCYKTLFIALAAGIMHAPYLTEESNYQSPLMCKRLQLVST